VLYGEGETGTEEAVALDKNFKEQSPPEFLFERFYNPISGKVELLSDNKDRQSLKLKKIASNINSRCVKSSIMPKK
jgi:hypothetical protein